MTNVDFTKCTIGAIYTEKLDGLVERIDAFMKVLEDNGKRLSDLEKYRWENEGRVKERDAGIRKKQGWLLVYIAVITVAVNILVKVL